MASYALQYLEDKYVDGWPENEHLHNMREKLKIDVDLLMQELANLDSIHETSLVEFHHVYLEILEHRRKLLIEMNKHSEFNEELIRKYLALIDVDEYKLREKKWN